jgi:hypothetical protein
MTVVTTHSSSGKMHPIPPVTGEELHRYLRHTLGDADASKIVREAKKLVRVLRKLAEAGERDAVLELVERIHNAPAL